MTFYLYHIDMIFMTFSVQFYVNKILYVCFAKKFTNHHNLYHDYPYFVNSITSHYLHYMFMICISHIIYIEMITLIIKFLKIFHIILYL